MSSKNKERRVVNMSKSDFDTIKKFCDNNALNMCKWLVKIAYEKMEEDNNEA